MPLVLELLGGTTLVAAVVMVAALVLVPDVLQRRVYSTHSCYGS